EPVPDSVATQCDQCQDFPSNPEPGVSDHPGPAGHPEDTVHLAAEEDNHSEEVAGHNLVVGMRRLEPVLGHEPAPEPGTGSVALLAAAAEQLAAATAFYAEPLPDSFAFVGGVASFVVDAFAWAEEVGEDFLFHDGEAKTQTRGVSRHPLQKYAS